jgi:hypothetical protein
MKPVGGLLVPIARLGAGLYLAPLSPASSLVRSLAWLDTGAPISVVPFSVQANGLSWRRRPGVQVTWLGLTCDVGHIDIWLTDLPSSSLHGPFSILAKFPQRDPPGPPRPVLLGLEFLLSHRASFNLPPPPQQGTIRTP